MAGSRIVLVHWEAKEAGKRARRLREAGHTVRVFTGPDPGRLKTLEQRPPDVFIIDLTRIPSRGRDLGVWLRGRRNTRNVPLVFVGGEPAQVTPVRKLLPDAVFTEWRRIRSAVGTARKQAPARPVSPGAMAGYSGTPLARKLGIKAGSVVVLLGAPAGFETLLAPLPEKVRIRRQGRGRPAHRVLLFARSQADLKRRFAGAARVLAEGGGIWIAWPKKASGVRTDLDQTGVRSFGLGAGFVDYKIGAIDATWSGLCFSRRKKS